jgi:1-acyl-sn-glycerol-3-phosphate acyltransferase
MTDGEKQGEDLAQLREQVYVDPRSQEELQRYYDWPMTHEPDWMYSLVRVVTSLYAWIVFRTTTIDAKNIPTSGPLICAPNHFSNIDHFFLGQATRRKVQFMAKSQLYKGPQTFMYRHGGVFPIQRGKRDEQSFAVAKAVLSRDGTVCIYSEGGRSRTGKLADRAKAGIGRIALETGATVLPIAIHGSSRVRNWKRLQLPKVTVRYGEPLRFEVVEEPTREQQQAAADEIFGRIKALYAELEAQVSG